MFIRNLRIGFRALVKRPGYSFINIFGLAIGLACFALISLFVRDELSYDKHHADVDRVYRVTFVGHPPNSDPDYFAVVSAPVGRTIREEVPGVESVLRIAETSATVVQNGTYFFGDRFWYAEPELFDVFSMPIVEGSREGQLERPNTMVITEQMATKYFPDGSPIGRSLTLNDSLHYEITAVVEDVPAASHFEGDFFISYATRLERIPENEAWLNLGMYTYFKVEPAVDLAVLEARIQGLPNEKFGEQLAQYGFGAQLDMEPLADIYLKSKIGAQIAATGDMTQVWVFSAVAIFILLLAGINFTNLATARSMERAREVGVRKAIGSSRGALVFQFLGESSVMSIMALVIGLILASVGLGFLNDIAAKDLSQGMLFSGDILGILLASALLSGLLGALYPALMLSGFKPVEVLKGSNHSSKSGAFVRKGLVATQFAISIGLIAGTIVVSQQLSFMRDQDLGFEKDQMLIVDAQTVPRNEMQARVQTVLDKFESISSVQQASFSGNIPGRASGRLLFRTEDLAEDDMRSGAVINVGYDYFENYQIPIIAGRTFSRDFPADMAESMVINENLVGYVGYSSPEEALGKSFPMGGRERTVIGVIGDYHHTSLKTEIQPTMFFPTERVNNFISLNVAGADAARTMEAVGAEWAALFPAFPFEGFFLDDDFNRQYQAEERLMNVFGIFSTFAIFIACLGLFGLAAFTAQQRTKEIGIRKILGANVSSLIGLLSREFAALVLVGLVVAIPMTIYGLGKWLEPFPYKIEIAWWVFGLAGLAAMAIALLTVGYQAAKVALADPVTSLRYE